MKGPLDRESGDWDFFPSVALDLLYRLDAEVSLSLEGKNNTAHSLWNDERPSVKQRQYSSYLKARGAPRQSACLTASFSFKCFVIAVCFCCSITV